MSAGLHSSEAWLGMDSDNSKWLIHMAGKLVLVIDRRCLLVCSCCHNKVPPEWGTQPTDMYCLTVLKAGSLRSRCWQGWFLLRPLSLACMWLSSAHVVTWSSLCVYLCQISSHKNISHTGLRSTLMILFNYLFKGPVSKSWGVRTATYDLCVVVGGHNLTHNWRSQFFPPRRLPTPL